MAERAKQKIQNLLGYIAKCRSNFPLI